MNKVIKKAAEDLVEAEHAIALSGAGISTESGVPDFRGPSGIWTKDPDAERRAYESYGKFLKDPREYWEERLRSPSLLNEAATRRKKISNQCILLSLPNSGRHQKKGVYHEPNRNESI
jgi:NAD-dependent SIR2 family protein deacetylase